MYVPSVVVVPRPYTFWKSHDSVSVWIKIKEEEDVASWTSKKRTRHGREASCLCGERPWIVEGTMRLCRELILLY